MPECSLEVYEATYGSHERYHAHLARRLVRQEDGDREMWVLIYGDVEPHVALFAGEERKPRRRRFPSRSAAEAWAAKLLGIDPDAWAAPEEEDGPTVH